MTEGESGQDQVVPKGLQISIQRGAELESAELDAALAQLAEAVANLEVPPDPDDEVSGFNYEMKRVRDYSGLKLGGDMVSLPKFEGPTTAWCVGRCGANSGETCSDYCMLEGG